MMNPEGLAEGKLDPTSRGSVHFNKLLSKRVNMN